MSGQSREDLKAESPEPGVHMKGGIYVKKSIALLLGVFFVSAVVGTGLLVYYYSPDTPTTVNENELEVPFGKFSTDERADESDLRLPTSLIPQHYLIQLQPFINQTEMFRTSGYTEITFQCVEGTNQIIFHANNITISTQTIKVVLQGSASNLTITDTAYDAAKQFVIVTLETGLQVNNSYIISMQFDGYLGDNLVGFYRSVYQDENGNDVWLAATQFEPVDARRAFPCFDEPALKATFDIQILRFGTDKRTISNMPRIATFEDTGAWPGWYWDIFNTTLPMSTYLVAFVVSDFIYLSSNENDHVIFRVWAREQAISQAEYALDIGPEVLTYYENYFSIPFPLPKQDMVALPDFDAGAMENWGLITYRETALLYDPLLSGASNKQRVGQVITHELAHQWFGDLVSPAWWSYIWLNEGFASYMENLGLDAVEPTYAMLDQTVVDNLQYVFFTDSLETSHPISTQVEDPDEIDEVFDDITYSKGASILRMINFFLTEATFKQGLTNYLNALAYSSATQDDLWNYLTLQAHADGTLSQNLTVKQIMDTWTLQMGYPVITVHRSLDGTTATLTQNRFLLLKNDNSTDTHNYTWWVPITYTTQDNPDFSDTAVKVWMSDQDKEIVIPNLPSAANWFIFNVQEVGYYRVNYDQQNWRALRDQLYDDYTVISTVNRVQIVDDAMDLARGGLLKYQTALDLTYYLSNETEYVVWEGSLVNLDYLEKMFTWRAGYGAMKNYLLSLLTPNLYNMVSFQDSLSDPHLVQLLRSLTMTWTCHLEYQSCVTNSVILYAKWMNNPSNNSIISPNLKNSVFCTAIAEGDEVQWDFAWNQYLTSNLGSDKDYLLYAMGCSRVYWILERYLDMAFTEGSGIRKQDAYKVFNAVARNDYGRDLAWNYLNQQWDKMGAYYGSYVPLGDFAYTASAEFNTEVQLLELEELRAAHLDDLGTATQSIDQAVENVESNIDWMNGYYDTVNQWLLDQGYGDGIGGQ